MTTIARELACDLRVTLRRRLALIGMSKPGNIELRHTQHSLHRPLRSGRVGAAQIMHQRGWNDLPEHAVTIPEPAAPFGLTTVCT